MTTNCRRDATVTSRIAMLFPDGRMETTPVIRHLASGLARSGFDVDVFAVRNSYCPAPRIDGSGVRLYVHPVVQKRSRESVPLLVALFALWVAPKCLTGKYQAYLAEGIRGLFMATLLSLVTRVPVIYHCLELYPSEDHKSLFWKLYKAVERWASRRAACCVISDPLRAQFLIEDNGISPEAVVQFPVSTYGPARRHKTTWLADRFAISNDKKIVLCAGSLISDMVPALELVQSAQQWPSDWVLVMHANTSGDAAVQSLRQADVAGRVIFSTEPVSYAELRNLVSSARIGLAVYRNCSENIYNLGFASGKLAEYLAAGVPIVVSDFRGMGPLVRQCRCGVCVRDMSEVPHAIASILSDEEGYAGRALDFFNRHLALENYLPAVAEAVAHIIENTRPVARPAQPART